MKRLRFLLTLFILLPVIAEAEVSEIDTAKANLFPVDDEDAGTVETVVKDKNIPSRWGYSVFVSPGKVLGLDEWARKWLVKDNTTSVAAELRYTPQPEDGNLFAEDYNYPTFSIGFRYSFNHGTELTRVTDEYNSILGDVATIYGKFSRPIWRTKHFEFAYYLGTGIGYSHKKYNKTDEVNNEFIGSIWNIYFTAGLSAMYKIDREWAIVGGVDFSHHSNGALYRPNKGTNALGPFIGMAYTPNSNKQKTEQVAESSQAKGRGYRKGFFLELSAGLGAKTLLEDWFITQNYSKPTDPKYHTTKFSVYGAFSFQTDLLYRYARRWASGIGFDVFYGDYNEKLKAIDKQMKYRDEKHSPWSIGIAAKHEIFFGQLSVRCGIGYYLYRNMGYWAQQEEKRYYERVGLFYSFKKLGNASLGFSVNAHLTKADFTELQISYPINL